MTASLGSSLAAAVAAAAARATARRAPSVSLLQRLLIKRSHDVICSSWKV